MINYIGKKCIACNKKFTENDDIVVCPECGTPYHRECYNQNGKCINEKLHEEGKTYQQIEEHSDALRCPRCGEENEPLSLFCRKCGMPFSSDGKTEKENFNQKGIFDDDFGFYNNGSPFNSEYAQVNFSDPLCGLNPDEDFEGVRLEELADFVGPNTFYYLPLFKRMKDTGHKLTWNFSAMLFPVFYFGYRKMFPMMFISALAKILIAMPSVIFAISSGTFSGGVFSTLSGIFKVDSAGFNFISDVAYFLNYAFMFLMGGFANWLYYRHCLAKVKKLKEKNKAVKAVVCAKGGVSKLALVLISVASFTLFMLFYIFLYFIAFFKNMI